MGFKVEQPSRSDGRKKNPYLSADYSASHLQRIYEAKDAELDKLVDGVHGTFGERESLIKELALIEKAIKAKQRKQENQKKAEKLLTEQLSSGDIENLIESSPPPYSLDTDELANLTPSQREARIFFEYDEPFAMRQPPSPEKGKKTASRLGKPKPLNELSDNEILVKLDECQSAIEKKRHAKNMSERQGIAALGKERQKLVETLEGRGIKDPMRLIRNFDRDSTDRGLS